MADTTHSRSTNNDLADLIRQQGEMLIRLDERMATLIDTVRPLSERTGIIERTLITFDGRLSNVEQRQAPPSQFSVDQAADLVRVLDWFDGRTSFRRALPGMLAGTAISGTFFGVILPHLQTLGH